VKAGGARVFALTNWARETFPIAERRFDFIGWFEAVVVSGRVGMRKPDARIFRHALDVFGLAAEDALFIDDSAANVASAESLGIRSIRFETPEALEDRLTRLGLLAP
jgi:2-haloacid dehalogenase